MASFSGIMMYFLLLFVHLYRKCVAKTRRPADDGQTLLNPVEDPVIVLSRGNKQKLQCFLRDARVSNLIVKVLLHMKKVEESEFYHDLLTQMENPEIMNNFLKVLGSESSMQMVIYGIGSIESHKSPRFQLSLAILMKRKFSWIGRIEVFDPIITSIESRVFEALGCCVLSVNEECRRQALTPTMFFMPHCDQDLYCNLLQANWRVDMLNRIVVFGNTFSGYKESWSILGRIRRNNNQVMSFSTLPGSEIRKKVIDGRQYMSAATRFMKEIEISQALDKMSSSFSDSGWHFFSPLSESELQQTVEEVWDCLN